MATRCSILAWRIPWTEEQPGRPQSAGSQSLTRLKRFSKQGLDIKTASKFMHETLSGTRDSLISQSSWKPHTESKDTKYVEI